MLVRLRLLRPPRGIQLAAYPFRLHAGLFEFGDARPQRPDLLPGLIQPFPQCAVLELRASGLARRGLLRFMSGLQLRPQLRSLGLRTLELTLVLRPGAVPSVGGRLQLLAQLLSLELRRIEGICRRGQLRHLLLGAAEPRAQVLRLGARLLERRLRVLLPIELADGVLQPGAQVLLLAAQTIGLGMGRALTGNHCLELRACLLQRGVQSPVGLGLALQLGELIGCRLQALARLPRLGDLAAQRLQLLAIGAQSRQFLLHGLEFAAGLLDLTPGHLQLELALADIVGLRAQGADLCARGLERTAHLLEIAGHHRGPAFGAQHLVLRAQALVIGPQTLVLPFAGFELFPCLLTRGKRSLEIGACLVCGVLVVVDPVTPGVELRLQPRRALRHPATPVPPIDEPFGQPSDNEPHDQPGHRTHLELHLPHNSSWEPYD
ncbi:MAG: hypothetical protein HONDAALG_03173 [Gammaproteobacteria bacterium]|nr:hypothetical protein [Gammaproteobacteria bacterium]